MTILGERLHVNKFRYTRIETAIRARCGEVTPCLPLTYGCKMGVMYFQWQSFGNYIAMKEVIIDFKERNSEW